MCNLNKRKEYVYVCVFAGVFFEYDVWKDDSNAYVCLKLSFFANNDTVCLCDVRFLRWCKDYILHYAREILKQWKLSNKRKNASLITRRQKRREKKIVPTDAKVCIDMVGKWYETKFHSQQHIDNSICSMYESVVCVKVWVTKGFKRWLRCFNIRRVSFCCKERKNSLPSFLSVYLLQTLYHTDKSRCVNFCKHSMLSYYYVYTQFW